MPRVSVLPDGAIRLILTAPETTEVEFGRRVRRERERRGLRQEDLARLMRSHGIDLHPSAFAKMELGQRMIRLGEAAAISRALGLRLDDMLTTPVGQAAGIGVALWYLGHCGRTP